MGADASGQGTGRAFSFEGARILVTRPESRAHDWIAAFRSVGAQVDHVPLFELSGVEDGEFSRVRDELEAVAAIDDPWIAFTSVLGVRQLERWSDARELLEKFRVASVGPATTAALRTVSIRTDLEPTGATGQAMAEELCAIDSRPSVHHLTAEGGLPHLEEAVLAAGGSYQAHWVYQRQFRHEVNPDELESIDRCDISTFASPSAVATLCSILGASPGSLLEALRDRPALAVGESTSRALEQFGFRDIHRAGDPSVASVLGKLRELRGTPEGKEDLS